MKKVFIIILSCLFIVFGFTYFKIHLTKLDNTRITNKIKEVKKNNTQVDNELDETQQQIDALKEENKDKWQELNTWRKTKEKIEAALQP